MSNSDKTRRGVCTVHNIRHAPPGSIYGGRPGENHKSFGLGNPFPISKAKSLNPRTRDNERNRVCNLFEAHFHKSMSGQGDNNLRDTVLALKDKIEAGEDVNVHCFCKPRRCHLDTVAAYLNGDSDNDLTTS